MKILGKIFLLIVFAFVSCSENQNTKYGEEVSDYQTSTSKLSQSAKSIFPHPAGFSSGDVHGKAVFSQKGMINECRKCHTGESKDRGAPKACLECHKEFEIHSAEEFKSETVHGPVAIEIDYRKGCVKCHGSNFEGGSSRFSCYGAGCHDKSSGFPHLSPNMGKKEIHPDLVFENDLKSCLTCHDQGSSVKNKKSCFDCHTTDQVHTSEYFKDPTAHASLAIQKKDELCIRCHGNDLSGGKSGVGCYSGKCHDQQRGFIHGEAGFKEGKIHGEVAFSRGIDTCLKCHGKNEASAKGYPSCWSSSCHTKANLHSSEEFKKPVDHGIAVVKLGSTEKCVSCHGDDLEGGKSQKSCFGEGCHNGSEGFKHFKSNFMETKNKALVVHGNYVTAGKVSECLVCHEKNVAVNDGFKPCFECHDNSMVHEGKDFRNKDVHGPVAFRKGVTACLECHSETDAKRKGIKSCYNQDDKCHDISTVHKSSQFAPYEEHGLLVLSKGQSVLEKCKSCHGNELRGNLDKANYSCYGKDCHKDNLAFYHFKEKFYPPEVKGQYKSTHGQYYKDAGKDVCNKCHQSGKIKNTSVKTCSDPSCHATAIHTSAEFVNPQKHGVEALKNEKGIDGCKSCHGSDLNGGWSNKSCYKTECHTKSEGFFHIKLNLTDKDKTKRQKHIKLVASKGQEKCLKCHEEITARRLGFKSCKECHKELIYSHPLGPEFRKKEGHGYLTYEKKLSFCLQCHSEEKAKEKGYIGCYSQDKDKNCHHDKSEIHLSDYFKPPAVHGSTVIKKKSADNCAKCHGDNFEGTDRNKESCYKTDCHEKGKEFYHLAANFKEKEVHGPVVKELGNNPMQTCNKCHGEFLNGNGDSKTCYGKDCHPKDSYFPHNKYNFAKKEVHGKDAFKATYKTCFKCHGLSAKQEFSCWRECHDGFSHSEILDVHVDLPFRTNHENHFDKSFREFDICKKCHGVNLKGDPNKANKSCAGSGIGCHPPGYGL